MYANYESLNIYGMFKLLWTEKCILQDLNVTWKTAQQNVKNTSFSSLLILFVGHWNKKYLQI